jgi:hypothetical protein
MYNWHGEFGNFSSSSVPLVESLKSKAHLVTDAEKRKNLTHLQRVLLFKDSSETTFNGLGMSLGHLSLLSAAQTRSISGDE